MNGNVISTKDGNEVIFSMAAKSNQEVDQWARQRENNCLIKGK